MSRSRAVAWLAAVLLCGGCMQAEGGKRLNAAGADAAPGPVVRVAVGDVIDDVTERIVAAGGQNISSSIGVMDYPRLSWWYILKDGTCLQATPAATDVAGREVVGKLTLGEPGRGYHGWKKWERQRRRVVDSVDLR